MDFLINISVKKNNQLEVSIKNLRHYKIRVLIWNTPFDISFSDCFNIINTRGEACDYIGAHFKRRFMVNESSFLLQPQQELIYQYDISLNYEIPENGIYSIELKSEVIRAYSYINNLSNLKLTDFTDLSARITSNHNNQKLTKNTALDLEEKLGKELFIEDDESIFSSLTSDRCNTVHFCPAPFPNPYPGRNYGRYFHGRCAGLFGRNFISYPILSSSISRNNRRKIIEMNFDMYVQVPKISVENDNSFNKWFGAYTIEKANIVRNVLNRVTSEKICKTYHISQNHIIPTADDVIAYIFTTSDYTRSMYLKDLFYTLPERGINSSSGTQYGTLIHELSHGYSNTEDIIYGYQNCINLAQSQANLTLKNADSYQYYTEEKIFSKIAETENSLLDRTKTPRGWLQIYNYQHHEGNAPVRITTNKIKRWGYIDKYGKETIKPIYFSAGFFSQGLAAVGISVDDDLTKMEIAFIDKEGKVVITNGDSCTDILSVNNRLKKEFEISYMPYFKNNFSIVQSFEMKRNVYMDLLGKIPEFNKKYKPITNFNNDGLALVEDLKNYKLKIITITGIPVPVKFNNKEVEILNDMHEYSSKPYQIYDSFMFSFSESGIYVLRNKDKKHLGNRVYYFYDKQKMEFNNIKTDFKGYSTFYNGRAIAFKNNSDFFIIDDNFNPIKELNNISFHFQGNVITENTISVSNSNIFDLSKEDLILNHNEFRFPVYINESFQNGLTKGAFTSKWGLISKDGDIITDFVYDEIGELNKDLICVSVKSENSHKQYRYINKYGKPIFYFD